MAIRVRPVEAADSDFIRSLIPRFSEFDLPAWRRKSEIDCATQVSLQKAIEHPEPDSAIFIAEDEMGTPAGFIHPQTQIDYFGEKHGYISELAVDQSFEGQGVGHLLLETAASWARTKEYRLLSLYVFAGNTHARRVYEKYGFDQEVIKYVKEIGGNS
jgi:ribosomal protein S18 acetylase RimI-like enzyme